MTQPWIHKKRADVFFILLPPFLITGVMLLFHNQMEVLQNKYSFYTWLFLIVGVDVAHVYASLFKTYLNKTNYTQNKHLYLLIPFVCFFVSVAAYLLGAQFFWSFLAYVAVYHFVRQQYGFMRLYSRNKEKSKRNIYFDNLIIYNATLFPMAYWFLTPNRTFNWFVENEFLQIKAPKISEVLHVIYFIIFAVYIATVLYKFLRSTYFNIPKNLLIIGTYLSWYLGIVYFNNELIFTAFNVISHGIPYMALIFFKEVSTAKNEHGKLQKYLNKQTLLTFMIFLLVIAFIEEYIWEVTVWEENFSLQPSLYFPEAWHFIWVPLLALPQLTHYVLDGFIWKSKKDRS